MKFIIDGDGTVSPRSVKDLLIDIGSPYPSVLFVIVRNYKGTVFDVLTLFDNVGKYNHGITNSILSELSFPGDKVFIVVGASTRPDLVRYCLANNVPVLDLEKGLYPVT